jgi:L-histidine Nalpha-methyltransferase
MNATRTTFPPIVDTRELAVDTHMAAEVRQTLTDDPPWIPSKYLYDDRGSRLFDEITALPEYYQTRTEERLLDDVAHLVVDRVAPAEIVELGSGAGRKVRALLDRIARPGRAARCVLVDINAAYVEQSRARLVAAYPGLQVVGYVADFERQLPALPRIGPRLLVLFAGTIGNLHPEEVPGFLSRVAQGLDPGDAFLVGLDLVKDRARLEAAYNDSRGVTAAFNLNILEVLNDRLGADFELPAFEHVAFFNAERSWIEMRVRAKKDMHVVIPASRLEFELRKGDEIRTEVSCKYTRETFWDLLPGTGFTLGRWFTDREGLFALALLERAG